MKLIIVIYMMITILQADKLLITTDEWYPYVSTSNDSNKGVLGSIVSEILKRSNIDFEIAYIDYDEGYEGVLKGKYNATFPYLMTSDRKSEVLYSDPIFSVENVLFFNKDKFDISSNDFSTVYTKRLGIVKGYAYKNIDIEKFDNKILIDNELAAFDMLDKGDIDVLPSNKIVGIHIIKKYFNDFYSNMGYIKDEKFISKDFLYMIFTKTDGNAVVIKKFNKYLKKIKKNGIYQKIILDNKKLLNTNLADVISLVNNIESFPMVVASDKIGEKEKYIIPRGTKAVVLEWSKHFKQKGNLKVYNEMFKKTKVKIVNGPLKGKVVYIENMYIEID